MGESDFSVIATMSGDTCWVISCGEYSELERYLPIVERMFDNSQVELIRIDKNTYTENIEDLSRITAVLKPYFNTGDFDNFNEYGDMSAEEYGDFSADDDLVIDL